MTPRQQFVQRLLDAGAVLLRDPRVLARMRAERQRALAEREAKRLQRELERLRDQEDNEWSR